MSNKKLTKVKETLVDRYLKIYDEVQIEGVGYLENETGKLIVGDSTLTKEEAIKLADEIYRIYK